MALPRWPRAPLLPRLALGYCLLWLCFTHHSETLPPPCPLPRLPLCTSCALCPGGDIIDPVAFSTSFSQMLVSPGRLGYAPFISRVRIPLLAVFPHLSDILDGVAMGYIHPCSHMLLPWRLLHQAWDPFRDLPCLWQSVGDMLPRASRACSRLLLHTART